MTIVESIEYRLGEISGKLDQLLERMPEYERRIRGLEAFKWKLAGALGAWSVIISLLVAWAKHAG